MKDTCPLYDLPDFEPLRLPFSWRDLPRRACDPGGYSAIAATARWTTALAEGAEVRLKSLYQYRTYDGVLAGLPTPDEVRAWPVEGAVRMAEKLFQCEPSRIAILPPVLMVSKVVTARNKVREEVLVEFLPAVCSIAAFECQPFYEDDDATRVVAVWFQSSFGLPEPGHVVDSIRAIDWENYASDLHSP